MHHSTFDILYAICRASSKLTAWLHKLPCDHSCNSYLVFSAISLGRLAGIEYCCCTTGLLRIQKDMAYMPPYKFLGYGYCLIPPPTLYIQYAFVPACALFPFFFFLRFYFFDRPINTLHASSNCYATQRCSFTTLLAIQACPCHGKSRRHRCKAVLGWRWYE